jgi:hypothetical protein
VGQIEFGETGEVAADRELHKKLGIVSNKLEAISCQKKGIARNHYIAADL